jgi:hypothetical protein
VRRCRRWGQGGQRRSAKTTAAGVVLARSREGPQQLHDHGDGHTRLTHPGLSAQAQVNNLPRN